MVNGGMCVGEHWLGPQNIVRHKIYEELHWKKSQGAGNFRKLLYSHKAWDHKLLGLNGLFYQTVENQHWDIILDGLDG